VTIHSTSDNHLEILAEKSIGAITFAVANYRVKWCSNIFVGKGSYIMQHISVAIVYQCAGRYISFWHVYSKAKPDGGFIRT